MQNIDLMNLSGFCRNCLSRWFQEAAEERGFGMSKEESRETVYGMPFDEWKSRHQGEADGGAAGRFPESPIPDPADPGRVGAGPAELPPTDLQPCRIPG